MEKKTGEAMSFHAVQELMRIFSLLALVAFLISKAAAADPAAEMASFSVFNNINVAGGKLNWTVTGRFNDGPAPIDPFCIFYKPQPVFWGGGRAA